MQNSLKNNDLVSRLFDVNEWFYAKKKKEYAAQITKSSLPKWSTHQNRVPARIPETPHERRTISHHFETEKCLVSNERQL